MPPVPDFHTGGFVFFVTNLFPQERNVKEQICGFMRRNCVMGKPSVLFLPIAIGMRNSYFVIRTELLFHRRFDRKAIDSKN